MSRREMWTDEMHDRVENLTAEVVQLRATIQDMVSVLLAIEWGYYSQGHDCCPACLSCACHGSAHRPDCALDAALRKAGVR